MNQPVPVHPAVVGIIEHLLQTSDDYLIEAGLVIHISATRNFWGSDWTWVSVSTLAEKSHMGFRRVKAALDHLAEEGLIEHRVVEGYYGKANHQYRIPPIPEEMVEDWRFTLSPRGGDVKSLEERRETLKKTPKHLGEEGPVVPVVAYQDRMLWYIKKDLDIAVDDPRCPVCGKRYYQTEGQAPTGEDLCLQCYLEREWEKGVRTFTILGKEETFEEFPEIVD